MGKHKKIINNDPILKKDYKYQKRQKQRALQKQAQLKKLQKQQKTKQQIAIIQHEVEQQIQNQLLYKINQYKDKKICKLPKQLFNRKIVNKNDVLKIATVNKQILDIKQCDDKGDIMDYYTIHFGTLPERIKYARQHKQSKKDIIDREVKQQIKQMFSIQHNNQNKNIMEDQQFQNQNANIKKYQISQQVDNNNPYILVKQPNAKQKQLAINNQLNLFTQQAYLTKQSLKYIDQNHNLNKSVIDSYKDYIYIQNKQQSTIQQFRKIIISHIIAHQNRCRKQQNNSKGFTNGKALILCPFFGDAKSILEIFQSHYEGYQIINKQKLENVQDQNDFFRLGICVNDRKKCIKYFSHFNVSNFIIGSPVGIKAIVGAEGQSERDFSFLSSVQILYIDRASVIYMQNWDHLVQVIKNTNLMPSPQSLCNDINKLRPSVPQLLGRLYRQTVVFSQYNFPQLNGLKHIHFHNWQGCITTKIFYPPQPDTRKAQFDIQLYKMQLKQPKDDLQLRFQFFKRKFWQQIFNTESMKKLVIFTRSYFQFIKIKQFLTRANASADFISQHTKKSKVQSKISYFNTNKYRILLLTQRAYYYNVCQIKKLQHLYFYSLPRNAYIYAQLISQIFKQNSYVKNKVVSIYTKYDIMSLQRIVGSKKAIEMIKEYCSNVSFVI